LQSFVRRKKRDFVCLCVFVCLCLCFLP
jgi:hypothetical protein